MQKANYHLNGAGCPICKTSKAEKKIMTFLSSNNISFISQKKFEDLKDDRNLSYDFYIPSKNLLIEFNGIQHYENSFGKSLHDWHKQLHHDWLKRKYAKKYGITLIVIPYWKFERIEDILKSLL